MTTKNRIKTVLTLAAMAMVALAFTATSGQAATTTITGTDGGRDSWNVAGNWDAGVPSGTIDVVIAAGVSAQVDNASTPTYSGSLTLLENSTLQLGWTTNNNPGDVNPLISASQVTMNAGSLLKMRNKFTVTIPTLVMAGDAEIETSPSTSAHNTIRNIGSVTGTGTLTVKGNNKQHIWFNTSNPSFSGGLISGASDRHRLHGNAAGAFGTGDVSINPRADGRSASLYIEVPNVMADTATLTLNGTAGQGGYSGLGSDYVIMNADDTIAALFVYGVEQPYGEYTSSETWLQGSGTLTVKAADLTLPSVDAGVDMITWSGQAVLMDPNVVNNDTTEPPGILTYLWTAEPDGIGDPNLDVAITDADQEVASVTITKTAPTGDATVVTMTLAVTLEGKDPVTDTMTIDVYDDACEGAKAAGLAVIDPTDFDGNCITNFKDFAVMATTWLDDYTLTGSVVK